MTVPPEPVLVYVALGTNLGERIDNLAYAIEALATEAAVDDGPDALACSGLYETPPMGPAGQPDYLNAVVRFRCALSPQALLRCTQAIERARGRPSQGLRWGARILDLDILLFGHCRLQSANLVIPHPGIRDRAFVLRPLADLAPDLVIPGTRGQSVSALLACVGQTGMRRLDSEHELSIHRR